MILILWNFINQLNENKDIHIQPYCVFICKSHQALHSYFRFGSSHIIIASAPNTLHWKLVTYYNSGIKRICMIWTFSKPQLNLKKKKKEKNKPILSTEKAYIIHFFLYCLAPGFEDRGSFLCSGFS